MPPKKYDPLLCPKCQVNEAVEGTCPYVADIYDKVTECNCCRECRRACAEDV